MNIEFRPFLLFVFSFLLAAISFYFYGPINGAFFNSDQAIHVLMALDFDWPTDAYYWGQNRLGSFLPMVSAPILFLSNVHPIWIVGLVNFSFVFFGFFIIQGEIQSLMGKVFFLLILFFPHPTYIYLLLIGHPYAAQFFTMVLAIWFYKKLKKGIESGVGLFGVKPVIYLVFFMFFYFISIWINELSVLLFLGMILAKYDLRNRKVNLFVLSRNNWPIMKWYWVVSAILAISFTYLIFYLKSLVSRLN